MNRLLIIHLRHVNYFWEALFNGVEKYRDLLLRDYPQMEKWMPKEHFNLQPIWPEAPLLDYQWEGKHGGLRVTGEFLGIRSTKKQIPLHFKNI